LVSNDLINKRLGARPTAAIKKHWENVNKMLNLW